MEFDTIADYIETTMAADIMSTGVKGVEQKIEKITSLLWECEENTSHNTRSNTDEIKQIIDQIIIMIHELDLVNDALYGLKNFNIQL
jgi:hypothetical protein